MRFPASTISPFSLARQASATSVTKRAFSISSLRRVPLLITPKEYKEISKKAIPLDVSWHMPNSTRSATAEFLSGPRIPGARRFDLDDVAELELEKNPLGLTHMLPTKEKFQEAVRKLGIQNDSHLVLYDTIGVFSSPRAAYTFKTFGHDKVSVLDGGLPRWIEEGGEGEVGQGQPPTESEYTVAREPRHDWVRSYEQIVENSEKAPSDPSFEVVLDHRPLARFTGEAPEPRPGLSSGHIPQSSPLPFGAYLNAANESTPYSSYKSLPELRKVLVEAVGGEENFKKLLDGQSPQNVVFTCGSGMTAAIGWLANELIREKEGKALKTALYDESWTGYALRQESKIVKGKA